MDIPSLLTVVAGTSTTHFSEQVMAIYIYKRESIRSLTDLVGVKFFVLAPEISEILEKKCFPIEARKEIPLSRTARTIIHPLVQ